MKKIIRFSCFSISFVAAIAVLSSQTACQKQSTNCSAVITTTDSTSTPIPGVFVKLYAPHSTAGDSGTTNAAGTISFTFNLPAIYRISARKIVSKGDTINGTGIIQLQVGQTESTSVVLQH